MIIILGLVILVAAVIAGVAGVLANGGHIHALTHFAVFGYHGRGDRPRRNCPALGSVIHDPRGDGPSPGAVPPQRERHRRGDEEAADGGEPVGDVDVLTDDREGGW